VTNLSALLTLKLTGTTTRIGTARRHICVLAAAVFSILPIIAIAQLPMTPADLDRFDSRKSTAVLSNGLTLAYLDVGPRDAPPVVLIHGYTDSARDWAPIEPLLTPRFRLIIVDLRGHGASSKPYCCYTRFDFAYDIRLLLDTLHIGRADVIGHSLGSIVAQTIAELWPGSTRRLVLISSTGTSFGITDPTDCSAAVHMPSWLAAIEQLKDPIDPDSAFMRDWWKESISINPEFFSRQQRRDAAAIPARVWRAIADQSLLGVNLRWMLPRIQAPTLLIWGGRDSLMTVAGRDALRTGIARVEVQTFPSLGHDLFWEDPQAVATVLIDFLAKQ
jgi:pimeloyl-ACP methyl ester carboxylesterase